MVSTRSFNAVCRNRPQTFTKRSPNPAIERFRKRTAVIHSFPLQTMETREAETGIVIPDLSTSHLIRLGVSASGSQPDVLHNIGSQIMRAIKISPKLSRSFPQPYFRLGKSFGESFRESFGKVKSMEATACYPFGSRHDSPNGVYRTGNLSAAPTGLHTALQDIEHSEALSWNSFQAAWRTFF